MNPYVKIQQAEDVEEIREAEVPKSVLQCPGKRDTKAGGCKQLGPGKWETSLWWEMQANFKTRNQILPKSYAQ